MFILSTHSLLQPSNEFVIGGQVHDEWHLNLAHSPSNRQDLIKRQRKLYLGKLMAPTSVQDTLCRLALSIELTALQK